MDNNLIIARVNDICNLVFSTDKPKFFGFLSIEEATLIKKHLKNRNINYRFFGGTDSSERTYFGCFPQWLTDYNFPITAVTFVFRKSDILHHRDFLGALMALGLKRETIGDILIEEGRAVVFLSNDIVKYVIENLKKIGNIGVSLKILPIENLPKKEKLNENRVTVSSLRLDCVVSALANCSRNNAVALIEGGLVSINTQIIEKTTKVISNGDILVIRRKGKFYVNSTNKRTKKDRIILEYKCY